MNIRLAKLEDLEEIVEIYNQAILVGEKTADIEKVTVESRMGWFKEHTPEKYPLIVAESNNKVIGYATISAYRSRFALRFTGEISYYIHYNHHRKGVGSKLLEHAINICPSLQIKTLFAILIDSNIGSARLLEKFHFEKWGHMPDVVDLNGRELGHLYYGLRIYK